MRRVLYWAGVLVAVLLLAAGVVVGALGFTATATPAGVVRGYFAALARSDAAGALAYGEVPAGRHTLLTEPVLHEQQRIAALRDVSVVSTAEHDSTATVDVKYTLAFPGVDVPVSAHVPMHKSSGDWRLDKVAVPIKLLPSGAQQRESILGVRLPSRTTLMFPGALPVRLDTPYLKLDPFKDNLSFDAPSSAGVYLQVTDEGRSAMLRAVRTGLRRCVTRARDLACPLPTERYVPGSIHGAIKGDLRATNVTVETSDPVGTLRFSGAATIAGRWQRLNFHNRQVTGHGRIELDLHAVAYAQQPLRVRWGGT